MLYKIVNNGIFFIFEIYVYLLNAFSIVNERKLASKDNNKLSEKNT